MKNGGTLTYVCKKPSCIVKGPGNPGPFFRVVQATRHNRSGSR